MRESNITLNDLSGAFTLPLFNRLLNKTKNIDALRELYQLLEFLYDHGQKQMAYRLICLCCCLTAMHLPDIFFEKTREASAQADFAGEVLEDLDDILGEYR